jgi:rhodanese-related sulfurtransferase
MIPPDVPSVNASTVPDGAVILDVRENDEWQAGRIDGARHIPLGEVPARVAEVAGDDQVVVVCRSGGRSARATAWLLANGVDAVNLVGGMGAWAAAGGPMVSDTGVEPVVL